MDFISRIRNQEFISKSLRKAFLSLHMAMIASKYMSYTRRTGTYTFSCPHLSKQLQFCLNVKKKIRETSKVTFQSNSLLQVCKHGAAMYRSEHNSRAFQPLWAFPCHSMSINYSQVVKYANPNIPSLVKDFVSNKFSSFSLSLSLEDLSKTNIPKPPQRPNIKGLKDPT